MKDMICPRCNSENIVKNGNTIYGKPKFMCKDCRKQFVKNPVDRKILDEKKELIDKLLPEKVPLAGICRATGVSGQWLQSYVNEKYKEYGPVLMLKQKKLTGYISADEVGKTRENSGNPFRLHIVNALLFILIYLNLISEFFLQNVIVHRQNVPEKQIILNVLIIPCARGCHDLFERHFLFRKSSIIIQVQ